MSSRLKRRYLAVQVESEGSFSRKDFMDAVWKALLQLFGEYGASKTNLALIEYDVRSKRGILRCSHDAIDMVRAAVSCVSKLDETLIAIHVLRVSGTLKALRKKVNM